MLGCFDVLSMNGKWSQQQGDSSNRNIAVGMQATLETALLASLAKDVKSHLNIIIHTNNPPTPLCADIISDSLFSASNKNDLAVLSTVTSRVYTAAQFLNAGCQVNFCSLYGSERSSPAEQECFDKKIADHAGCFALHTHEDPPVELSGATYVFTNGQGDKLTLGVRITQANVYSEQCSLFISNEKNRGNVENYLRSLHDYISQVSANQCIDSTVKNKIAVYELMALQRTIGY
ncbi:hypothetical protein CIT292_11053 [Citrobacter youngae ATCC 29220]|uniref:Uncharacterized protein n=2 Tax=Citrobacter youngae TaxID=133448 RepID=D4BKH6_9ENTR|nr:hypothetical protein CIT292_11053 [Citrobacter youngae ATCC 29220]